MGRSGNHRSSLTSQSNVQLLDKVLFMGVHVLFDGALVFPGGVVVERDPAFVIPLSQDLEQPREIHPSRAEVLIEIYTVMFLRAGSRAMPTIIGVVLSLAILEMYGGDAR